MTPQELQNQIDDLKKRLDALSDYSLIPTDVQNAFEARLAGLFAESNTLGTFNATNLTQTLNLSGNAQSISVLEFPTQYISVKFGGSTVKIPIFVD